MSFQAFCDSLYHNSIQIMRYETFVINIIIEQKNIWENPMTYQRYLKINSWYSNKIRCKKKKKKYPNSVKFKLTQINQSNKLSNSSLNSFESVCLSECQFY